MEARTPEIDASVRARIPFVFSSGHFSLNVIILTRYRDFTCRFVNVQSRRVDNHEANSDFRLQNAPLTNMGARQSRHDGTANNLSSANSLDSVSCVDIETAKQLQQGVLESKHHGAHRVASISSQQNGLTIALDGVGCDIKVSSGSVHNSCTCKQESSIEPVARTKVILNEISGVIERGAMCAVMGQSGSGKTTLLDIISGRKTEGRIRGKILFDGVVPSLATIKKYTAYVPQHEAFFGGATVAETVTFAAMIKLPGTSTEDVKRKLELVEHVIDQMNLSKCRDTLVGNHVIRGISGGELKRLAVASALCTSNPRAMFLDEPTSGLDSSMAADVINCLSRLQAEDGRTLLVTVHQPSMPIYQSFNKLILLTSGMLAYFGEAGHNPMDFFINQGFPYEAGFNIAEYFIDTISTGQECAKYYAESSLRASNLEHVAEITSLKLPMNAVTINTESSKTNGTGKDSEYAHNPFTELGIMIRYKDAPKWRYAIFWFTRCGLYVILAALLSAFFYQQKKTPTGILNTNGIMFIACILPSFMAQVHVEEVKFEREVYTREFHESYYRPGNYVASKIIAEMPMTILASLSFSAVLYWCVGLNPTAIAFFFFVFTCLVNFTISQLIGCTISAAIPGDVGPASVLPIYATINMLVGGFFIRARTIHNAWRWLYNISFIQWAWSSIMVNEYDGREFFDHCGSDTGGLDDLIESMSLPESSLRLLRMFFSNQSQCDAITGESVLRTFSLAERGKWMSLLYASLSVPVYLATFYFGVSRVRHEKR